MLLHPQREKTNKKAPAERYALYLTSKKVKDEPPKVPTIDFSLAKASVGEDSEKISAQFISSPAVNSKRSQSSLAFFKDPELCEDVKHKNYLLKVCNARHEDVKEYRRIKQLIKRKYLELDELNLIQGEMRIKICQPLDESSEDDLGEPATKLQRQTNWISYSERAELKLVNN